MAGAGMDEGVTGEGAAGVNVAQGVSAEPGSTRSPGAAFVAALGELAAADPRLVVLASDGAVAAGLEPFQSAHEDRFFNLGAAERNLIGVAAGMAAAGKIPIAVTSGAQATLGAADLLRTTVGHTGLHLLVAALPAGLEGAAGSVSHALEDLAVVLALPGWRVVAPADAVQTAQALRALVAAPGPAYLRLARAEAPVVLEETSAFELGTALVLREGTKVTLVVTGPLTVEALRAAELLDAKGISARVLGVHTLKPLDVPAIRRAARETGGLVVVEEHRLRGGLGAAVAQELARTHPAPVEFVAVGDEVVSGVGPAQLRTGLGLGAEAIAQAAERLAGRAR